MATFSWSDTARAAFGSCLPSCLRFSERHNDEDEQYRQPSAARRDELESLLQGAEFSDVERDGDILSLHSQIGGQRDWHRKIKRTQRRRSTKRSITFFGLNLFGRPLAKDEDDNNASDGEYDSTRRSDSRVFRISSSTLDSDAASLPDDAIAALSAQTAAPQEAKQRQWKREQETVRKERRRIRKQQKKVTAKLFNIQDGGGFEGFVGSSGGGGGADDFGAFQQAPPASDTELDFVNVRGGGTAEVYLDNDGEDPNGDGDPDASADFDAGAYVRTTATARSDSGSGSGTRSYSHPHSHSRASVSNHHLHPAEESPTYSRVPAHRVPLPPSSSGSADPLTPTHSGASVPPSPLQPRPKRSKRSGGKRSTTTASSSTPSQPRSPVSTSHIPHVDIASPTSSLGPSKTFEGFPRDDEDDAEAAVAFAHKLADGATLSRSSGDLLPSPARGDFPSSGLGGRRDSSASAGGNGVFLARTGDDA